MGSVLVGNVVGTASELSAHNESGPPSRLPSWEGLLFHCLVALNRFGELRQRSQNSLNDISTTEHPLIKGYRSQAQPARFFLWVWCIRSQGLTDKARARCPKTVTLADTAARSIEPK